MKSVSISSTTWSIVIGSCKQWSRHSPEEKRTKMKWNSIDASFKNWVKHWLTARVKVDGTFIFDGRIWWKSAPKFRQSVGVDGIKGGGGEGNEVATKLAPASFVATYNQGQSVSCCGRRKSKARLAHTPRNEIHFVFFSYLRGYVHFFWGGGWLLRFFFYWVWTSFTGFYCFLGGLPSFT